MAPEPLYSDVHVRPAYSLRYSWTGWPSSRSFHKLPSPRMLDEIQPLWEEDGMRLLEHRCPAIYCRAGAWRPPLVLHMNHDDWIPSDPRFAKDRATDESNVQQ